jgi:hypothetical protein
LQYSLWEGQDELAYSAVITEQVLTLASCLRTTTVLAAWTSIASLICW